jgi:glycosyltransferase involved in cell wall biosynthesis
MQPMEDQGAQRPRGTRGRVVMLVDNGVNGDSRVQKIARSAADAGWEVTLLGIRGRDTTQTTWRIGDAEVRLIEVNPVLIQGKSQYRRSLRRPLAYPPGPVGGHRQRQLAAWRTDLGFRLTELRLARASGASRQADLLAKARLLPSRVALKVVGRWVRFRKGEQLRLKRARANPRNPLNALPIAFWTRVLGDRSWRRLYPGLWDYVLAFAPVIDQLEPDLIHAHDFRMTGVGARAAMALRGRGHPVKLVWDAHEFVPGVLPRADNPRWLPAHVAYEREHARYANAVVTVSPTLADLLRETHGLPEQPAVVLNAPVRFPKETGNDATVPDLRALCGIGPDTPLLAYCGGVNPVRGVDLMVDALPDLPGVHVALVTLHPSGNNPASDALRERAERVGVADRVHLLPYVPHWQVAAFLSAADAGVIPIHHQPNHEIALITKFFEYSHARLPIVVSDVKTMSETVQRTGQGEVFRVGDRAGYVRAVRVVLTEPQRYRAAYDAPGLLDGWTWEAQAEVLEGVYRRLLPGR